MGREALHGIDVILIVNKQKAMMSIRRVLVLTEAEAVPAVEPGDLRMKAVARFAHLDVAFPPRCHCRLMP